jgi:hypothetical protein
MSRLNVMSRTSHAVATLGIDIGGVLIPMAAGASDTTFFGGRPMETPAQPYMFDAVRMLTERFDGRVHLVSKCGPKIERISRDWLSYVEFWSRTGVTPENLHFVRERPDKALVCRRLDITHFIDDRLDVLLAMHSVHGRYLFLGGRDGQRKLEVPAEIRQLRDWEHAARTVSPT